MIVQEDQLDMMKAPGRRIVPAVLICFQLILVAIGLARWQNGSRAVGARFVRLDTGVPQGVPLTVESALDAATRQAKSWAPDATVFAAGMQVDWPLDASAAATSELPGNGWVLFTFGSAKHGVGPAGKGATMSMVIDRQSGTVIDERELGWSWSPARRLAITTYPISSTIALFAADASVGLTYRTSCPQFRHLSRVSLVPYPSGTGAYWLVTYEDTRSGGRPELEVRIDATTGDVDRFDEPTTC